MHIPAPGIIRPAETYTEDNHISNKSKAFIFGGFILVGGLVWGVLSWSAITIRIADIIYDNKLHNIPCDQLPQRELVERVLENNNAAVIAVEAMTEGSGWVEVGFLNDCPQRIFASGFELIEQVQMS